MHLLGRVASHGARHAIPRCKGTNIAQDRDLICQGSLHTLPFRPMPQTSHIPPQGPHPTMHMALDEFWHGAT
ncbi:hypothetical protein M407DRAFT_247197 [Tulasnella calospora MUT 4182]|uniref:Uncharacterized protein n=1 Tax=Tulasnella calospora MUT 4182 TaxID=1051891 RepID=A0A0C3Q0F9_9AGAM|nr:hypothetical protein M407DRAFT_247239 [Tulasnella calospora MUT 4182]KIO15570.1 hypothetical protein M407DRAFT_247197 [Tulasnella calospora MUT 4182]